MKTLLLSFLILILPMFVLAEGSEDVTNVDNVEGKEKKSDGPIIFDKSNVRNGITIGAAYYIIDQSSKYNYDDIGININRFLSFPNNLGYSSDTDYTHKAATFRSFLEYSKYIPPSETGTQPYIGAGVACQWFNYDITGVYRFGPTVKAGVRAFFDKFVIDFGVTHDFIKDKDITNRNGTRFALRIGYTN